MNFEPAAFSIRRLIAVLILFLFPFLAGAAPPPPPNFIVIVTDDQRWDCLGTAGHPILKTPHLDRLAAEGIRFTQAFVTTSICCISRASIATGLYARRHRVADFSTPLPPEIIERSFPAVLKRAGYYTGCLGKWGIGGPAPAGVFDFWDAWGGQGTFFHALEGEEVHNSEFLARRAEKFLRSRPASGAATRPFCLLVNYKSPHDPYFPDPRHSAAFERDTIAVPRTYSEAHFAALPAFIRESEGRARLQKRHPTPEAYQAFVKQYLRCILSVDESVGRLLALLEELKLAENTVVVFTSDNGFFLGEHGMTDKWLMHEESIRVPFIIRDPRLLPARRGMTCDDIVLNIDLAPTVLALAGLEPPAGTDGRSLAPLLAGERADWRQDFFYEHHYHHGGRIPRTEGVRTRRWKYITYFDVAPPFEEMYDLAADPLEERNLAKDPAHAETLKRLKARYEELRAGLPPAVVPAKTTLPAK